MSSNTILTNKGAIFIGDSLGKARKNAINAQSQLASGLKNPDPATDPSAATLAMRQQGDITIASVILDVVVQAESIMQLAVGILQSNANIMNRMQDLAVRSNSSTIDDKSRSQLNQEFSQLLEQLEANSNTKWGEQTLFNGEYQDQRFQIGISSSEIMEVSFNDITNSTLNISDISIENPSNAATALSNIEEALNTVLDELARVASFRSRLGSVGDTMTVTSQNLKSVLSTYQDVDVALALTEAQRQSTLIDAASSALQTNVGMFTKLGRLIQNGLQA